MHRNLALCAAVSLIWANAAQAGGQPPEPLPISPAIALHVSTDGLNAMGDAIAGILPTGITATGLSGEFVCDEEAGVPLLYSADDINIHLSADEVSIVPSTNRLDIILGMTLWSDDADITVQGPCVLELDELCTLGLPPTPLNAEVGVQLALVDGELQANVSGIEFTHGNFGNPVETGCILGDALETLQGYGVDLIGSILDDLLESQLGELEAQLDEVIGGLTTALSFEDELDLAGLGTLGYSLTASGLTIDESGLVITLDALFTTPEYGDCVPQGPAYVSSAHDMPLMTGNIPGTSTPYHLGVHVSEDLANQAAFALWQGGMFCIHLNELEQVPADLLVTDALPVLGVSDQETVQSIWPESIPLELYLKADEPPRVPLAGGLHLEAEMALDAMGMELGRETRLWGNGVFIDVPIDIALGEGELLLDVGLDFDTSIGFTVAYNEWLPPVFAEEFGPSLIGAVGATLDLETLIPSSIALPTIYGLGLADLDTRVVGDNEDWLGIYAWVNPADATPIEIGEIDLSGLGCGDTGDGGDVVIPGCEDGGCGADSGLEGCNSEDGGCGGCGGDDSGSCGSCDTGRGYRAGARTAVILMVPLMMLRRRRR